MSCNGIESGRVYNVVVKGSHKGGPVLVSGRFKVGAFDLEQAAWMGQVWAYEAGLQHVDVDVKPAGESIYLIV